jgi:hypothetical protein
MSRPGLWVPRRAAHTASRGAHLHRGRELHPKTRDRFGRPSAPPKITVRQVARTLNGARLLVKHYFRQCPKHDLNAPESIWKRLPSTLPLSAQSSPSGHPAFGEVLYWMLSGGHIFGREDHRAENLYLPRALGEHGERSCTCGSRRWRRCKRNGDTDRLRSAAKGLDASSGSVTVGRLGDGRQSAASSPSARARPRRSREVDLGGGRPRPGSLRPPPSSTDSVWA